MVAFLCNEISFLFHAAVTGGGCTPGPRLICSTKWWRRTYLAQRLGNLKDQMLFWGDPASECAYRYFLDPQDGPKSPFYFANHSFLCNKKSRCTYKSNCYVPDEDGSNFILLSHIIISSECPASKTHFVLIWMSLCCISPCRQTVSFYHHFFTTTFRLDPSSCDSQVYTPC